MIEITPLGLLLLILIVCLILDITSAEHPTKTVIDAALEKGALIDKDKLAKALAQAPKASASPQEIAKHLALLRQLRERVDADRELALAALQRDRALAALAEAEQTLNDLKKKQQRKSW